MSLIEGVGDDVAVFVAVVFTVVVLILAWISTYVTDRFLVSVIVLDRATFQHLLHRLHLRREPPTPAAASTAATGAITGASQVDSTGSGTSGSDAAAPSGADNQEAESPNVAETGESGDDPLTEIPLQTETTQSEDTTAAPDTDPVISLGSADTELSQDTETNFTGGSLRHRFSAKSSQSSFTPTQDTESVSAEGVRTEVTPSESNVSSPADPVDSVQPDEAHAEGDVDSITVKIRFLDERQKEVQAKSGDTIGEFKRRHFANELAENFSVRFVFNGQELRQDNNTLQSYNVRHNSVVHCLLNRAPDPTGQLNNQAQAQELDLSILMFPLFGLILALIWYCRFTYRNYFNAMSTFSLIGITFLFLVAVMAAWRPTGALRGHDD